MTNLKEDRSDLKKELGLKVSGTNEGYTDTFKEYLIGQDLQFINMEKSGRLNDALKTQILSHRKIKSHLSLKDQFKKVTSASE
mmetsp:Transcript_33777/g.32841  ORF Transcript_33777/g.32841 Transcript_33777/m.32841 type:complete len:83 (-) Transcript_33777:242-490(-)